MAITDEARNHLFNKLRETLGADDAASMMELLPPVGWADVARQRDLDRLEATMERRFDAVERRFEARFDGLPSVFATKAELEAALRSQTNHFIGWMVGMNAALVAAVGLITSLR
jgi:hypothetical protein